MANPILRLNIGDNKIIVKADTNPVTVTGSSYYQFEGVYPTVVTDVVTGNLHTIQIDAPAGADGADGAQGLQGLPGDDGLQGLPGNDGAPGADGINGLPGADGAQGLKGDKGDTGLQGLPGQDGTNGTNGLDGADGYTPIKGVDYFDGTNGTNGINGLPGADGINGLDGYTPIKGVDYFDGAKGDTGASGATGQDGYTPIKGVDYFDGINGTNGLDGASGATGAQGYTPIKGVDYFDGVDGLDGVKGDKGDTGASGTSYSFVPSGATQVSVAGNLVTIYSPTGSTWADISGKPEFTDTTSSAAELNTLSGMTYNVSEALITMAGNIETIDGIANGAAQGLYDHSGDTSIHFQMSGITVTELQVTGLVADLAAKSNTGHTHTQYTPTGTTATLQSSVTAIIASEVDVKGKTGFIDGSNIAITYNHTNRTITLTGNLIYYFQGVKKQLGDGSTYTSPAHTATAGGWWLKIKDGLNTPIWEQVTWNFSEVMISFVSYNASATATFGIRETHGTMDWNSHEDLHRQLGTMRISGGGVTAGSYAENTATDAGNSMGFDAAVLLDEDLKSVIDVTVDAQYTLMSIGAASTSVFTLGAALPFVATTNTYIQVNNVLTGAMTAGVNSRWYNVYQILVPTTNDANSKAYRVIMLQPQVTHTSLAAAQAEDVRGLKLGQLALMSEEFVIYSRITYVTSITDNNNGRCRIATNGITYVIGNKQGQVSTTASPTNHANLSNLNWVDSGHLSDVNSLASFNASGVAESLPKATFSPSGHTHSYAPLASPTFTGTVVLPSTTSIGDVSDTEISYLNGVTSAIQTQLNAKVDLSATINAQSGTYAIVAGDNGKIIECDGTFTITFPNSLATGFRCDVVNVGTGVITIAASTTLQSAGTKLATQYTGASVYHRGSNVWLAVGLLTV